MSGFLEYKDGWLCVVDSDTLSSEPIRMTRYWPIAQGSKYDFEHLIGLWARQDLCCHTYSVPGAGGLTLCLKDGGKTRPLVVEETAIPKPRGKQVRWNWGKWEKYTKRGGWVPA